jgi:hypothetical protein
VKFTAEFEMVLYLGVTLSRPKSFFISFALSSLLTHLQICQPPEEAVILQRLCQRGDHRLIQLWKYQWVRKQQEEKDSYSLIDPFGLATKKRILESNTLNYDMKISIPVITSKIPSLRDFKASKRKENNTMDHDTTFDSDTTPLAMLTDASDSEDGVSSTATSPLSALEAPTASSPSSPPSTSSDTLTAAAPPVKQMSALEVRRAKQLAATIKQHQEPPPATTPRSLSNDQETPASKPPAKPMSALEARRARQLAEAATEGTANSDDQNSAIGTQDITATTIGPDRLPTKIYNSPSPPPQSPSPLPVVYSDMEKDDDDDNDNEDEFATPYDQSEVDDMEDQDTDKATAAAALAAEKKAQALERIRLKE